MISMTLLLAVNWTTKVATRPPTDPTVVVLLSTPRTVSLPLTVKPTLWTVTTSPASLHALT